MNTTEPTTLPDDSRPVTATCVECGTDCYGPPPGQGGASGYATRVRDSARICYGCAGKADRADMIETGRGTLYLTNHGPGCYLLTNWPGTLRYPVGRTRTGRHNWTGRRRDVWFRGPDGATWWGWKVEGGMGEGQCINVRRIKG